MNMKDRDRPESERLYRYWVELRDLSDGSARILPLHAMKIVYLGGKKGSPPKPDEQVLRLEDDTAVIEAKDIDELAARLRRKYPDGTHERVLRCERDYAAEQRKADALRSLIQLLAEAAVEELLREQAAETSKPRPD
jgi:hypothetical protein